MARLFFKSKSLRKYASEKSRVEVVATRLPCNKPWNVVQTDAAAKAAAYHSPCRVSRFCRDGKTAVLVVCPGSAGFEPFKDRFFNRLDRLRREGKVSMSGRKRR